MKKYTIRITETLEKDVTILASSKKIALEKVHEQYTAAKEDEYILTADDYSGVDFQVVEEC